MYNFAFILYYIRQDSAIQLLAMGVRLGVVFVFSNGVAKGISSKIVDLMALDYREKR